METIETAVEAGIERPLVTVSPSVDTAAQARPPTTRRRMVVIVNPATHGDADAIVNLLRHNAPAAVDLDIRITPGAGTTTSLTRAALEDETGVVVAVGGDGTVAQVAAALLGTDIPLGVIPAGSTNITAREAGIPDGPAQAVSLLFGPHRHVSVDAGLWGEVPFFHMAGAGLDSRLFADCNPALKRRVGWLAYVLPALRDVPKSRARFTVIADGVALDLMARAVLVANGSSIISPRLSLFPGIRTDDGWLDVLAFTPQTFREEVRLLASALTGRLTRSPYVTHRRARQVRIVSDPPLPFEVDGDVVTTTPVTVTVAPSAVRFIVP